MAAASRDWQQTDRETDRQRLSRAAPVWVRIPAEHVSVRSLPEPDKTTLVELNPLSIECCGQMSLSVADWGGCHMDGWMDERHPSFGGPGTIRRVGCFSMRLSSVSPVLASLGGRKMLS